MCVEAALRRSKHDLLVVLLAVHGASAACSTDGAPATGDIAIDSLERFEMDSATVGYRDVVVGPDGTIWALTETAPFVQRFSPDGRIVARFGREGGGPGELRNPSSLVPTGDAARPIRVHEPPARAIIDFNANGAEIGRVPIVLSAQPVFISLRKLSYGRPRWVFAAGPSVFVLDHPRGANTTGHLRHAVLARIDGSGVIADTLAVVGDSSSNDHGSGSAELVPIPLAAPCADGSVLLFDPGGGRLRRLEAAGTEGASASLRQVPRPLSNDEKRTYLRENLRIHMRESNVEIDSAEAERMVQEVLEQNAGIFPTTAPEYVSLLCDPEGRAWLQTFSVADHPIGYGRQWRVLDGGRVIATVTFPAGFQPRAVIDGAVIGILTDELDVQRIARAPLPPSLGTGTP